MKKKSCWNISRLGFKNLIQNIKGLSYLVAIELNFNEFKALIITFNNIFLQRNSNLADPEIIFLSECLQSCTSLSSITLQFQVYFSFKNNNIFFQGVKSLIMVLKFSVKFSNHSNCLDISMLISPCKLPFKDLITYNKK